MKKWAICFLCFLVMILPACTNSMEKINAWGSFTSEKTFSYDNKFYAVQSIEEVDGISNILVSVYLTETNELLDTFMPARAVDFWGICWEQNHYHIWIQSADIGIVCYQYQNDTWTLDETAIKPDYIISKYDE